MMYPVNPPATAPTAAPTPALPPAMAAMPAPPAAPMSPPVMVRCYWSDMPAQPIVDKKVKSMIAAVMRFMV